MVLRDLISPYLLRRRKADVATQLPKKTETVLFCSLTPRQRDLYRYVLPCSYPKHQLAQSISLCAWCADSAPCTLWHKASVTDAQQLLTCGSGTAVAQHAGSAGRNWLSCNWSPTKLKAASGGGVGCGKCWLKYHMAF